MYRLTSRVSANTAREKKIPQFLVRSVANRFTPTKLQPQVCELQTRQAMCASRDTEASSGQPLFRWRIKQIASP